MGSITVPDRSLQRQKKPSVTFVSVSYDLPFRCHGRGRGLVAHGLMPTRDVRASNGFGLSTLKDPFADVESSFWGICSHLATAVLDEIRVYASVID
jgi:hypothetical protein